MIKVPDTKQKSEENLTFGERIIYGEKNGVKAYTVAGVLSTYVILQQVAGSFTIISNIAKIILSDIPRIVLHPMTRNFKNKWLRVAPSEFRRHFLYIAVGICRFVAAGSVLDLVHKTKYKSSEKQNENSNPKPQDNDFAEEKKEIEEKKKELATKENKINTDTLQIIRRETSAENIEKANQKKEEELKELSDKEKLTNSQPDEKEKLFLEQTNNLRDELKKLNEEKSEWEKKFEEQANLHKQKMVDKDNYYRDLLGIGHTSQFNKTENNETNSIITTTNSIVTTPVNWKNRDEAKTHVHSIIEWIIKSFKVENQSRMDDSTFIDDHPLEEIVNKVYKLIAETNKKIEKANEQDKETTNTESNDGPPPPPPPIGSLNLNKTKDKKETDSSNLTNNTTEINNETINVTTPKQTGGALNFSDLINQRSKLKKVEPKNETPNENVKKEDLSKTTRVPWKPGPGSVILGLLKKKFVDCNKNDLSLNDTSLNDETNYSFGSPIKKNDLKINTDISKKKIDDKPPKDENGIDLSPIGKLDETININSKNDENFEVKELPKMPIKKNNEAPKTYKERVQTWKGEIENYFKTVTHEGDKNVELPTFPFEGTKLANYISDLKKYYAQLEQIDKQLKKSSE